MQRVARGRAGRLGVPASLEHPRTWALGRRRTEEGQTAQARHVGAPVGWWITGPQALRTLLACRVMPHGGICLAPQWRLGPGQRGGAEAANTCWAAATPAPRATV